MGLRDRLYQQGMREDAAEIGKSSGFVAVAPLVVRECDETGLDDEACASDAVLIETGRSQEPILVQYGITPGGADPFDRKTALWVLGKCAFDDATRWLSEFGTKGLVAGPALWLAISLDYSLGNGAARKLLSFAGSMERFDRFDKWLLDFAPSAEVEPWAHWWGRCPPALARKRIVRVVRRLESARALGSLDPRDVPPPAATLPADCRPMPEVLRRICERLIRARKAGTLTPEMQEFAHAEIKGYARTLDRQRRRRPVLVKLARLLLPREMRHPEAALVRRAA
jgi:hypothetical protein